MRPMGVRSQEVAVLSADIKVIDETTRLELLRGSGEREVQMQDGALRGTF